MVSAEVKKSWRNVNKDVGSVRYSNRRDLAHDAYMIMDVFKWVKKPTENEPDKLEEYLELEKILEAIEKEMWQRIGRTYTSVRYNDDEVKNHPYIEFLRIPDVSRVRNANIMDMYHDMYRLIDYFVANEEPSNDKKNTKKLAEYKFCEQMMEEIEKVVYERNCYVYGHIDE